MSIMCVKRVGCRGVKGEGGGRKERGSEGKENQEKRPGQWRNRNRRKGKKRERPVLFL